MPWNELPGIGNSALVDNSENIKNAAAALRVDNILIQAILFIETSHGYYDIIPAVWDGNKSILPMNINTDYWGNSFGTREELKDPAKNVAAGTIIIRMIYERLPKETQDVNTIATLYNNINAKTTTAYGARVTRLHELFRKQQNK